MAKLLYSLILENGRSDRMLTFSSAEESAANRKVGRKNTFAPSEATVHVDMIGSIPGINL